MTPANLLVGAVSEPTGTIYYAICGSLSSLGKLYDSIRRFADRTADNSDDTTTPLIIAAGNHVILGIGPAAATVNVSAVVTWREQGNS